MYVVVDVGDVTRWGCYTGCNMEGCYMGIDREHHMHAKHEFSMPTCHMPHLKC